MAPAKRQFETGYTSRLELMQADSELRSTRAQIPPLQHQIAQQENALSVLLGDNPGAVKRGEFAQLTPLRLPSQLPSTLLNRRPDIAQAERQLVAADATLASSQAQLLPSINLTATGSLQDRTLPDLLDNPLRLWSLGGSILAPLLNRRALNARGSSPWPSATVRSIAMRKRCAARSKRSMTARRHQSLWRTVNRASGTRDRCP